jgi:putative Ca2+/H+ antiporter (TMEM165/GDT1 family)
MDLKVLATVFGIVFLAELGDKTQLATLLFASKSPGNLLAVFIGASAALVFASAIGVLAGSFISQYISPRYLSYVAGAGFIVIGAWTIWQGSNLS